VEDAAIASEADDAFLDAGASTVVETDDRRANLQCEVHQLVDLLREHLAQRATEDGEVLTEDENLAAVDGAPAGNHTIGVRPLFEPGTVRPMACQQIELLKTAFIEQDVDSFASQQLALGVLALDGSG